MDFIFCQILIVDLVRLIMTVLRRCFFENRKYSEAKSSPAQIGCLDTDALVLERDFLMDAVK